MRRLICAVLVMASVGALANAGEGNTKTRFWTDDTGDFTVKATLKKFDQESVTLKLSGGDHIQVPLHRLSADDRAWLELQQATNDSNPVEIAGINWFSNLEDAQAAAAGKNKHADKPIMCFRALGDLSGFM